MGNLLFGAVFFLIGIFSIASAFSSRARIYWGQSDTLVGRTSRIGFGMVFAASGAIYLVNKEPEESAPLALVLFLFTGIALTIFGFIADTFFGTREKS